MKKYLRSPQIVNIELTTICPWKCPQCYKKIKGIEEKNFGWSRLQELLVEAKTVGVRKILFSGGEPLFYPWIKEAIKLVKKLEMELYISTGGVEIQDELYDIMTQLDALYISLNGSTEEVNQKSRDGFKAAKRMLFEAKKRGIKTRINWVARRDNVEDFPQLCKFAEDVGVEAIDILKNKPDARGEINGQLQYKDIEFLANFIMRNTLEKIKINIESCFFELRNLCGIKIKNSILKGCSAGKYSMAINVWGYMMPCTHADGRISVCSEANLIEFWNKENILKDVRDSDPKYKECEQCQYYEWCSPCPINWEKEGCILNEGAKDV